MLLTAWPRLRDLLDEHAEARRRLRTLVADACTWASHGRDHRTLPPRGLRRAVLDTAREAGPEAVGEASDDAHVADFVRAVARAERRSRFMRISSTLLTVMAVVVAGASAQITRNERAAAGAARLVAAQRALAENDPSMAAQLAVSLRRRDGGVASTTRLLATQREPLWSPLRGHTQAVIRTVYRPDGKVVATASHDDTVQLWNVDPSSIPGPIGAPIIGHHADLQELGFSADGSLLVSADRKGGIRVWNVGDPARPTLVGRPLSGHVGEITAVTFSPDNRTVLSTAVDGTLRVWDVPSSRSLAVLRPEGLDGVYAAAFSPDARLLAFGGKKWVRVVSIGQQHQLRTTGSPLIGVKGTVDRVLFSPDARLVIAGDSLGDVRLWKVDAVGTAVTTPTGYINASYRSARALSFPQGGTRLAIGATDGTAQIWDVRDPSEPQFVIREFAVGVSVVYGLALSPDGRRLIVAGSDRDVRLWDLPPDPVRAPGNVTYLAYSPDGATLATYSPGQVQLWDARDPRHVTARHSALQVPGNAIGLAWSAHGHVLALAEFGDVRLWDVTDPARPRATGVITIPRDKDSNAMALSPDGRTVMVGYGSQVLRFDIHDPAHPRTLPPLVKNDPTIVTALSVDATGHRLAQGDGYSVRLWDLDLQVPVITANQLYAHTGNVLAFTFSSDGTLLASGGNDAVIKLWDVSSRGMLTTGGQPLTGNREGVPDLAMSPDARVLASAGNDGTVQLWDLTSPDTPSEVLGRHGTSRASAVAFAPDGTHLTSSGTDDVTVVWDLDPHRVEQRVCASTGGVLTRDRWNRLNSGLVYDPPCPTLPSTQ